MNIEITPEQSAKAETSMQDPFPKTMRGRVLVAAFVLVMPALLFLSVDLFKPEWQSGKLSDYVILFLFPEASWVFVPFLIYSIICYLLLLTNSNRYAALFVVRFGIYTGVIVALQFGIAVLVASADTFQFLIPIVWGMSIAFYYLYGWSAHRWGSHIANRILLFIVLGAIVISAVLTSSVWTFPTLVLIFLAMITPAWCFLLALRASLWLFKNWETKFTLVRGIGMAAWLLGYVAVWRFNILKMFELYNALPPSPPPDCYIATAAAGGHSQLVRSWTVADSTRRVNHQLQILKCAELALMAIHPQIHQPLRKIYDRAGKFLAQRIQHPFLADLAYLMLKPWEWLAYFSLKILIPEIDSISRKMYLK